MFILGLFQGCFGTCHHLVSLLQSSYLYFNWFYKESSHIQEMLSNLKAEFVILYNQPNLLFVLTHIFVSTLPPVCSRWYTLKRKCLLALKNAVFSLF